MGEKSCNRGSLLYSSSPPPGGETTIKQVFLLGKADIQHRSYTKGLCSVSILCQNRARRLFCRKIFSIRFVHFIPSPDYEPRLHFRHSTCTTQHYYINMKMTCALICFVYSHAVFTSSSTKNEEI